MTHKTLILNSDTRGDGSGIVTLTINRPEYHNAFDDVLIAEMIDALDSIEKDSSARLLVLRSEGGSFSAGADLNWMSRMANYSYEENKADAVQLASLMQKLNQLSKSTIAIVQGAAFGGGVGLVSCCDIAIASTKAVFCLSEVRLGLIPAVISPYVIAAIGQRAARRYFATAERFDAQQALRLGLVHEVVEGSVEGTEMEIIINDLIDNILRGGPKAQSEAKEMVLSVSGKNITESLIEETTKRITSVRCSDEAKEGMKAFLEKRSPDWKRE